MLPVERAVQLTKNYGTPECNRYRRQIFASHEYLAPALARYYCEIAEKSSHVEANRVLKKLHKQLTLGRTFLGLYIDSPPEDVRSFAEQRTTELIKSYYGYNKKYGPKSALEHLIGKLAECDLALPVNDPYTAKPEELAGAIARALDSDWWRRQIRKRQDFILEQVQITIGNVHLKAGIYISQDGVRRKCQQWQRNEDLLKSLEATNDLGEVFNLFDVVNRSVSNLTNRRNEMMTRISGAEAVAKGRGDQSVFYTITAPSKYHRHMAKPCKPNPKYEDFSPLDTQLYLNTVWKRIRAKLKRDGIEIYGLRVVEPHHDGTPHWHLLLFIRPDQRAAVEKIFRYYALQEDPNEKGARLRRLKIENIDPKKGSAVGYIAKYIAKNIDGKDVGEDLYGRDAIESAVRIRAWASNWNIRQFQFIGSPSVTVWRELRRAATDEVVQKTISKIDDCRLDELVQAADSGDWAAYIELSGGPATKLSKQPLRAFQVERDRPNKYGEATQKILGLIYAGAKKIVTRVRTWTIGPTPPAASLSVSELCFSSGGANAPPLEFCQ